MKPSTIQALAFVTCSALAVVVLLVAPASPISKVLLDTDSTQTVQNKTLYMADGTATSPSITFTSDTDRDTGFYWVGQNELGLSAGKSLMQSWNTGQTLIATGVQLIVGANTLVGTVANKLNLTHLAHAAQALGDLIYADSATSFTRLAKDTNSTRYLSNTGTGNVPAWAQVNLANGVTGSLPGAAKVWAFVTVSGGSPTLTAGYGVSSVSDGGTALSTINFATAFSSNDYACVVTVDGSDIVASTASSGTASVTVHTFNSTSGADSDDRNFSIICHGDQ